MSDRLRLQARAATVAVRRDPVPAALLASAAGWVAMVWLVLVGGPGAAGGTGHGGHLVVGAADAAALPLTSGASHGLALWLLMVLAMSPLLIVRDVDRIWAGSLRRNRTAVLTAFLAGYTAPWAASGIVAVPLADAIASTAGNVWPVVVAVLAVVVWHLSPARRRFLNVCHRRPALRAFGGGALWDATRFGLIDGAACTAACGPLMVLVMLADGWHLVVMAAATVVLVVERHLPARRPRWQVPFIGRLSRGPRGWRDASAAHH
ncbi:DUF2182 domain-containing protein [Microbacterium sp. BWT-B31]|uniref:copper chaperone n=1 Tax=Microbacterium sp. BWT-B31 TaxID=3232072 RepID=UPI003529CFA4